MFGHCDICGREADLIPWQETHYDHALGREYVDRNLFLCVACLNKKKEENWKPEYLTPELKKEIEEWDRLND